MPKWDLHFNMHLDDQCREMVSLVARAHALADVILDIPIPPPVKGRLDALNILRAVRGTTGIEGAELTEDEVRQIMESPRKRHVLQKSRSREEQEARNAEKLMYYVAESLNQDSTLPLTEKLIRKVHEITTKGIDYPNNIPGKYRTHDVHAGSYLPPSGDKVGNLMSEFIRWFNGSTPSTWDPIVQAVVAHFYIVSIHPFGDGNGRTSRGVESFLLYRARVNPRSFYSLANYYYKYRQDYVQFLDHVRFNSGGDLTPFVLFALRGLVSELEEVHAEVLASVKRIAFRDYARELLALYGKLGSDAGERMANLLAFLSGGSIVSLREVRGGKHTLSGLYAKLTPKTLSRDINFLKKHELVVVAGDEFRANLDIMTRYVPPREFTEQ
jgi:Fic family protein